MTQEFLTPLFEIDDGFCIVYKGEAHVGTRLRSRVDATAARLRALGLKPGGRVAICGPKSVDLCVLMLATWALGGVAVPLFSGLKAKQMRHALNDSEPTLVFAASRDFDVVAQAHDGTTRPLERIDAGDAPGTQAGNGGACADWPAVRVADADPALIVYTSGSTGQPKGVVFSRSNLVLGAKSVARFMRLAADDRVLCLLPFSFDAGLNQFLSALIAGATAVLIDFVHASQVEECCAVQRITSMTAVPGLWSRIGMAAWRDDARLHIRRIGNTGGHLQADLLRRLQNVFSNANVFLMYGFTEAFRATCLDPAYVAAKPHSVGRPIPFASVAVVSEDGRLCGPNEVGELVQFGPLVTLGYRNLPEENAVKFRPIPDGLLSALMGPAGRRYGFDPTHAATAAWSGDLVSIDEDGDIVYRGRKDDLIKVNGFRVCAGDVEDACIEAGLAIAIAIGVTGQDEEGIVVFAKAGDASPGEREVRDRLRASLPAYMVPRQIVFIDDFPLTANGKFDRQALRLLAPQGAQSGATA
ncbi:AMP-binding protein [Trinickia caryophylli]|uniref:Acyl-CoA synthetase (AMP-forming)/AMP-acid ligase II n=1 Tax=Trinickia caryophylli TaxID=28094 RepID=A0A1X7G6U9_TRICW|nr:AMP-binding protein [Trinickia caryophylli]WQE14135.1 AMP-binding protein [Trinickia caryophylli]GLU33366.1 acyl-CoA ligase (AMP-forming), exosortase A system-associated [Trinickia caryophylli]SMF64209.1 Acyl-CoA synthetase (AMP-forming)/AMP-acid ligase II [Trinickia caryophylli]